MRTYRRKNKKKYKKTITGNVRATWMRISETARFQEKKTLYTAQVRFKKNLSNQFFWRFKFYQRYLN